MLNIFGMPRKVAREGTDTRLTPVHWAKRGRFMHGNLVSRDGYGDTRDMFAVCRHLHRTESSFLSLTAVALSDQHVHSILKL